MPPSATSPRRSPSWLALLGALLLSACALGAIRHAEFGSLPPLVATNPVPVALSVDDGRAARQDVVHLMTVRFGVTDPTSGPAPDLDPPNQLRSVEDALAEVLTRRGLSVGAAGRAMQVTVLDLHACSRWDREGGAFVAGTFASTPSTFRAATRVRLRITVRDAAGRETFLREYEAGTAGPDLRLRAAKRGLNEALTAVATAIVGDEALLAALASAATPADPRRPAPLISGDYRRLC